MNALHEELARDFCTAMKAEVDKHFPKAVEDALSLIREANSFGQESVFYVVNTADNFCIDLCLKQMVVEHLRNQGFRVSPGLRNSKGIQIYWGSQLSPRKKKPWWRFFFYAYYMARNPG